MSKKSRRRNKKILAALTAGLGAAALVKGRKGAVTDVPLNPNLQKTIAADAGTDIAEAVVPNVSSFKPRVYAGTMLNERGPKIINPNIDNPYVRKPPGTMRRYKGGGIANRGMGAAFKRGGHVKSMGIAKRGGGVAKR